MRTSFHHQPEAQHPIFQLSTSWQADYPIFRGKADMASFRSERRPLPEKATKPLARRLPGGGNAVRIDGVQRAPHRAGLSQGSRKDVRSMRPFYGVAIRVAARCRIHMVVNAATSAAPKSNKRYAIHDGW